MSDFEPGELLAHLRDKWHNASCPYCQHKDWDIIDKVLEVREYHGGKADFGPGQQLVPVIPVTCRNCGSVAFINAKIAGIVKQQ